LTVPSQIREQPALLRRPAHAANRQIAATTPRGTHLGRPATSQCIVSEIEALATFTGLSVRAIQKRIAGRASNGIVGEITKRARAVQPMAL